MAAWVGWLTGLERSAIRNRNSEMGGDVEGSEGAEASHWGKRLSCARGGGMWWVDSSTDNVMKDVYFAERATMSKNKASLNEQARWWGES